MNELDDLRFEVQRARAAAVRLRRQRDEAVAITTAIFERSAMLPYGVWMKILEALEVAVACCSNPSPRMDGLHLRCSNCNAFMTPKAKPKKK